MEKYYASCPATLEERVFEDFDEARAWVAEHNDEHPPEPGQPPAQVFPEDVWEALHAPDAG